MRKIKEPIYLAWGGGKDSVMMLHALKESRDYEVTGLISCVAEGDQRTLYRGVGRELLEAQAKALGLPLTFVLVPKDCCYKKHTICLGRHAMNCDGIRKIAFGDLFLDEVRDAREEQLETLGIEAIFPLWHSDTNELALYFLENRFKAVVTSVEEGSLDLNFVGRMYDRTFLYELPIVIDPCGENGEFHTFVYDGPLFKEPVSIKVGSKFTNEGFHYCDLVAPKTFSSKKVRRFNSR